MYFDVAVVAVVVVLVVVLVVVVVVVVVVDVFVVFISLAGGLTQVSGSQRKSLVFRDLTV